MKDVRLMLGPLSVVAMSGTAAAAPTKLKGHHYAAEAKVSLATARQAALKARPGTITDQELEKEKGGSGLRYSFDITSHGKPYEVGIDARSGVILENVAESKNPD
ncbi:PepSY domain-containing protein [Sphingomonas yunnanensis]|uniref:PepSY domain-containing protein n=1 Tax=Sphingomonas yunnanensis TaxID=310400 RepID=UPI001CA6167C|nr:PepSY domain-containing protein [Sphingomonas yunnanensis]MBY9062485.1 PepSY domain-containing protein [Sphingomonas yunnanensis]